MVLNEDMMVDLYDYGGVNWSLAYETHRNSYQTLDV